MSAVKARVMGGRLVLDMPTTLPEGTELDVVIEGDELADLDESDRTELDEVLRRGLEDLRAGNMLDAEDVLRELEAIDLA